MPKFQRSIEGDLLPYSTMRRMLFGLPSLEKSEYVYFQ